MKTAEIKTKKQCALVRGFRNLTEAPLKWYDWVILLALMAFCFLCYQMRDLYHTAGCSYGYLNGHIFDFYDYVNEVGIGEDGTVGLGAAYLPTIYVIFAIWNIPMKLLGLVDTPTALIGYIPVMWAKVLPCLVYFIGGYVVFLIAKELGMGDRKAKFTMYAYLSMPIALFSQFVLGQYESFVVLTVLLGVYTWLRKKDFWFVFWFALGMTFKYTVIIFFIPLLFLREKNIWKIILMLIGVVSLAAIEILIYKHSPAFNTYAFGVGNSDAESPMNSLFAAGIFTGNVFGTVRYYVYIVVIAFILVAAFAYFKTAKDEGEEKRYAMYLLCLSFASLFCFTKWHAHYLMLAVPFWVLTAMMSKHTKIWMVLDLLFMVLFSMYNVEFFAFFHDEALVQNGLLRVLLPNGLMGNGFTMKEMLGFLDPSLVLTLLTALIAVYGIFKHPKFMREDLAECPDDTMGWLRARTILGMLSFIVPSLLALWFTLNPPKNSYMEDVWDGSRVVFTEETETVAQPFTATGDSVSKLKFRFLTENANEDAVLTVKISEDPTGKGALYEKELDAVSYYSGERVILKPGISVEEGKTYYVVFSADNGEGKGEALSLMTGFLNQDLAPVELNGKKENYHLALDVMN